MSSLSGYDSEAVGFESISRNKRLDKDDSTQTSEFFEAGISTQTNIVKDCGTHTNADDFIVKKVYDYSHAALNEFLKKVVPAMTEQLELNEMEQSYEPSDSDEEEIITAKIFQEIKINRAVDNKATGDDTPISVLAVSWSCIGNTLAVSIGRLYHDEWCQHDGIIKIYNSKRTEEDQFEFMHDILENSCISVLKYHPIMNALLAYGTVSGDVCICKLRNVHFEDNVQLKSPSDSHGSKRISFLFWADDAVANSLLSLKLTGKRRGATDKVLLSSGSDGKVNVWQVNVNLNIFESILCYQLNGVNKSPAEDITCFDFAKSTSESGIDGHTFAVGTKSGRLVVCKTKSYQQIVDSSAVDPVQNVLEGHETCILNIYFNSKSAGLFASASTDSEIRIYDVKQKSPLKVLYLNYLIYLNWSHLDRSHFCLWYIFFLTSC